jgi:hypothetical protein
LYTDCAFSPYRTPPKMIIFITFLVSTFTEQDQQLDKAVENTKKNYIRVYLF